MTRSELIGELKACEKRIATLNTTYQCGTGPRPSEADPAVCERRKELRKMLVERTYESDTP